MKSKRRRSIGKVMLTCIIAFILVYAIIGMLITKKIYDDNFKRTYTPSYSLELTYDDITGYPFTQVSFMSGKNSLVGYIYGEDNHKGLVVIAHGLGCYGESFLAETMYFVEHGWRVFVYDCTGSGKSEGKGTIGLAQSVLDIDSALKYIEDQNWSIPVVLYGHSWGGYAVTAVLNYQHDVKASVSLAGYATPFKKLREESQVLLGRFSAFTYPFEWTYQRLLFGKAAGLSAIDGINKSGIPVFIAHGINDQTVKYDGASIIAHKDEIINPNVIYVVRDGKYQSQHSNLFLSEEASIYLTTKIAELKDLRDKYNGEIPLEIKETFYEDVDKFLTCELDQEFMGQINSFFEKSLKE